VGDVCEDPCRRLRVACLPGLHIVLPCRAGVEEREELEADYDLYVGELPGSDA
jgi:hypothetical protein